MKQQFEKYSNKDEVVFLCKGRYITDDQHCEKMLSFIDRYRKETRKQISAFVCPLRKYVEGEIKTAFSRKKNFQIIKKSI
jgi:hypothetical protein